MTATGTASLSEVASRPRSHQPAFARKRALIVSANAWRRELGHHSLLRWCSPHHDRVLAQRRSTISAAARSTAERPGRPIALPPARLPSDPAGRAVTGSPLIYPERLTRRGALPQARLPAVCPPRRGSPAQARRRQSPRRESPRRQSTRTRRQGHPWRWQSTQPTPLSPCTAARMTPCTCGRSVTAPGPRRPASEERSPARPRSRSPAPQPWWSRPAASTMPCGCA